jgi:hypothetical protein
MEIISAALLALRLGKGIWKNRSNGCGAADSRGDHYNGAKTICAVNTEPTCTES